MGGVALKKLAVALVILLAVISGCGSGTGPSDPGHGNCVAWFNGLGYTVDLYYPADGTLLSGAFVTGEAPNDIVLLDDGLVAVVNSLSSSITFFDPDQPGTIAAEIELPVGSNPYCACTDGSNLCVLPHGRIDRRAVRVRHRPRDPPGYGRIPRLAERQRDRDRVRAPVRKHPELP